MSTRIQGMSRNENMAPTGAGIKSSGTEGAISKLLKPRTRGMRQALGDLSNRLRGTRSDDGVTKQRKGSDLERPEPAATTLVPEQPEAKAQTATSTELKMKLELKDVQAMDTAMSPSFDVAPMDIPKFDVDAAFKDDPQMCTEYIGDIMNHLRKIEGRRAPSPQYMAKQTDINPKMREILVDWLVEVHNKFKLRLETLYLTANLIDRFLERRAVKRTKLQLVGCTAMLLASKYEEIYAPEVRDFVYISDKAYTHEQILAMEGIMLNTLKFNMTVPSSLRFAQRFIKVAGGDKTFENLTLFILESHLQKYQFLSFLPSIIAASAVFISMKSLKLGQWDEKMVTHTNYSAQALEPCICALLGVLLAKSPRYRAVRKKYSTSKMLNVASLELWTPPGFTAPSS